MNLAHRREAEGSRANCSEDERGVCKARLGAQRRSIAHGNAAFPCRRHLVHARPLGTIGQHSRDLHTSRDPQALPSHGFSSSGKHPSGHSSGHPLGHSLLIMYLCTAGALYRPCLPHKVTVHRSWRRRPRWPFGKNSISSFEGGWYFWAHHMHNV